MNESKCLILGVIGPAGSGVSSVAEILTWRHDFIEIAFDLPLLSMVKAGLEWSDIELVKLFDQVDDRTGLNPRKTLEAIRETLERLNNKSLINIADFKYQSMKKAHKAQNHCCIGVVFSGLKTRHDIDYIKSIGGSIIGVTNCHRDMVFKPEDTVITPMIDYHIHNKGDFNQLRDSVRQIINHL